MYSFSSNKKIKTTVLLLLVITVWGNPQDIYLRNKTICDFSLQYCVLGQLTHWVFWDLLTVRKV